jgi:hypothetical protein
LSPSLALNGGGMAEGILTTRDERGRVMGIVIAIRKKCP